MENRNNHINPNLALQALKEIHSVEGLDMFNLSEAIRSLLNSEDVPEKFTIDPTEVGSIMLRMEGGRIHIRHLDLVILPHETSNIPPNLAYLAKYALGKVEREHEIEYDYEIAEGKKLDDKAYRDFFREYCV